MNNRKILSSLCALLALAAYAGSVFAGMAGRAQFVNGEVRLIDVAGQARALIKGDAVNEGDTVDTAKESSAQLKMQDGGFIAVRPETRLKIDSFQFKGKEDGTENSFFSLFKGGFRAVTGLIGRVHKQNYRVTTPVATIGIRGTDHESFFTPVNLPGALAGAYSKVNIGETSLTTDVGTVNIGQNQMGYAAGLNQPPQLQPINTNIFTVPPAPVKELKKEEKGGAPQQAASAAAEPEVRSSAVVDNTSTAAAAKAGATAPAETGAAAAAVTLPPPVQGSVQVVLVNGGTGTALNATSQTITSSTGQTVTIQNGTYDVLAQAAAAAAQAAANAAATADTALAAIAQVSTAPATAAIAAANGAITTASPLVASAAALTPANAATAAANAAAVQTTATTAANRAAAAQAALTANGTFADTTAAPANTATQSANTMTQNANASVQTAAGAVVTQNTALTAAQTSAGNALTSASNNVTTANGLVTTANSQNAAIVAAQTAATGLAAQARAAATAAQAAATQAASLQAAGDFTGAAAQLVIAQQQLAIAQSASTTLASQLAAAQAAQTAASTAVTNATTAANTAAAATGTGAAGAQTYASAAQTASTSAAAALAQTVAAATGTPANTVQNQAAIVAANAPIAAYSNPAVVAVAGGNTSNGGFNSHVMGTDPVTMFGFAADQNAQSQTNYVLDGNKNLIEIRQSAADTQTLGTNTHATILNADVKLSGGIAKDTFQLADNSLYMGRWQGGTIVVTDALNPTAPQTITLGATSVPWAVLLSPTLNYVQSLTGTAGYTLVASTHPTDSSGNVGTLTNAYINANFTSQTADTGVNLSFSTTDLVNVSAKNMAFSATATAVPISGFGFSASPTKTLPFVCTGAGCGTTWEGDLGGVFVGANAINAALFYTIHPVVANPAQNQPYTDLVRGMAALSTATPPAVGAFDTYAPSHTEIGIATQFMSWGDYMAAPGGIAYTGSGLSSFTQVDFACCLTQTFNVIGGATPVTANATSFATTGIAFGRWTSATALENINTSPLGSFNWNSKTTWMYGPAGYLDPGITAPAGQMYGTFNYVRDGNTAPFDAQSKQSGILDSVSLSANFANSTFSASLGLHVGNQFWSASTTGVTFGGNQFFASSSPGNAGSNLTVMMGPGGATVCPAPGCYGDLEGAFTGQNFAGAILAYDLWSHGDKGGNVNGSVALVRTGAAITNGAPVTPTQYFVSSMNSNGANIQTVDTLNNAAYSHVRTPGGVLTTYSSGSSAIPSAGYSSTTVTCTACTVTPATNATTAGAPTGIYFGTWDAGSITSTWGSPLGTSSPHWITGPEAGPLFLPNALVGTKSFNFDGGMVTNGNGVPGTVLGTTALTVDFTKQVVGINVDVAINDTAATPALHTWNAKTLAGNEAVINGNKGIGGATFWASSYSTSNWGKLTVTVDGAQQANGTVSGQLTGVGLTGAIMSYDLFWSPTVSPFFQEVNGVAALIAPNQAGAPGGVSDVLTPHRQVMVAMTDATAIIPQAALGFYANAPARVLTDVGGNLTQFDMNQINTSGNNASHTLALGTSTPVFGGSDAATGISWGRWAGGSANVTNRATGTMSAVPLAGSAHWIAGPTETAAVSLPVSGTFTYVNTGGTAPTDNLGNAGVLNSATLQANFTAKTVNVGVNVTVAAGTLNAAATNLPIIQKTVFYADSRFPVGNASHLTVSCTGSCGASHEGAIIGGFTGAGATGAMMSYGLEKIGGASPGVVSGVAAFKR